MRLPSQWVPLPKSVAGLRRFHRLTLWDPREPPCWVPLPKSVAGLRRFQRLPQGTPWAPLPKSVAGLGCSPPNLGSILSFIPSGEMK